MIMKNEAARLPRCLNSVMGLVDEIIIVDTGSADESVKIAKSFGARVLRDPWQDDFARPRNVGLKQAQGQWILIMDPDEMISKADHVNVKWLTRNTTTVAYWLTTLNYSGHVREPDYRFLPHGHDPTGRYPGYTPSTKTRFFKNGLGIRFEGCYHELVDYYLVREKLKIGRSSIPIHHWVHEIAQKTNNEKKDLYLRLGEKKVREWPCHGQARWELAVTEMIYGYRMRASQSIVKAIQLGHAHKEQFFALSRCQHFLKNKELSNFAYEKGICCLFPALTHVDPAKKPTAALIDKI